jgi:hypothetical protein
MTEETPVPLFPTNMSPPLTVDVADDHGGLIIIITSVCLSVLLTCLGFRIYAWHTRHRLQNEDVCFTIMTVGIPFVFAGHECIS